MKRYAYYPGCSLEKMSSDYDASFRNLCALLEIGLDEPRDWFCCGAGMIGNVSPLLGLAVPLKNLALARETGIPELIAPCAACYNQFKRAQAAVSEQRELRRDLEQIIEAGVADDVEVLHPIEMLARELERRPLPVVADLSHLRVACYYGCLLTRPPRVVHFDDCENPRSMDRLLRRGGIGTVDWSHKTSCCGAFYAMVNPQKVLELARDILQAAADAGANVLAVACPVCQLNLDARQPEVNARFGTSYDLPVVYFTQLLGVAFGIPAEGLGLWRHVVDARPLLANGRTRPLTRPEPALSASEGATLSPLARGEGSRGEGRRENDPLPRPAEVKHG